MLVRDKKGRFIKGNNAGYGFKREYWKEYFTGERICLMTKMKSKKY